VCSNARAIFDRPNNALVAFAQLPWAPCLSIYSPSSTVSRSFGQLCFVHRTRSWSPFPASSPTASGSYGPGSATSDSEFDSEVVGT
jgi:hypothetical protein